MSIFQRDSLILPTDVNEVLKFLPGLVLAYHQLWLLNLIELLLIDTLHRFRLFVNVGSASLLSERSLLPIHLRLGAACNAFWVL